MTQLTLFKLVNVALLIVNAVIFFVPKKPMSNVSSNAAGILALIAMVIIVIFALHLILTGVAIYYNKIMLLKILTFLMVPASLVFWFYAVPMIRL
jgi:hypothetical protein